MRDIEETLTITEQELEIRAQRSTFVGRAACLEELEEKFKNRAGDAFAAGKDDLARSLRQISGEFRADARRARERQGILDEHVAVLEAEKSAACKS